MLTFRFSRALGCLLLLLALAGCVPLPAPASAVATRQPARPTTIRYGPSAAPATATLAVLPTATPRPAARATATPAARPTAAPRPAAKATATPRPAATATPAAASAPRIDGFDAVTPDQLPAEARATLALIAQGGPFPYRQDGAVFQNRERRLPRKPAGYYHEYTVVTPGSPDRGARRIIAGARGELFYTADHYDTFVQVLPE